MLSWLSKDGKIIFISRGIRSFAFGFLSVLIGIYLSEIGTSPILIGVLLSLSILGGAFFTILTGRYAARSGIKKMLLLSMILSLIGISIFVLTQNYILLLIASAIGFISPSGRELGPILSLEQAYLPSTVSNVNRTKAFAFFNIIASLAVSIGALLASLPVYLQIYFGVEKVLSFKILLMLYFVLNLIALFFYTQLSELKLTEERIDLSQTSRNIITRLSLLFAVDSFAGGFVITSIVSLWFFSKFKVPLTTISPIFFAAGLLESLSYYLSGKLAIRIGLIRTMVFTHIPSNILLILISFAPSFYLAAGLFLLRGLLSEMDIPAEESYVVAVVKPEEKTVAASATNAARITFSSISPVIASRILLLTAFSPFVIAGTLKIAYDLSLYFSFRQVKPPEEISKETLY